MVSLSQSSIDQIRENLNSVADTINESIEEQSKDVEKEQENKEEKKKENIIDKEKTSLTAAEKKRFGDIAKIFVTEWLKSIEDIEKVRKRREALVIKKKKEEPKIVKETKAEKKEESKTTSWWKKILAIIGSLGLIYYLFKDKIKEYFPGLANFIDTAVEKVTKFVTDIVSTAWEKWIKPNLQKFWDWLKEQPFVKSIIIWWEGEDGNGGFKKQLKIWWEGEDGKGGLKGVWNIIKSWWDKFSNKASNTWDMIKAPFEIIGNILGIISNVLSIIISPVRLFVSVVNAISGWVASFINHPWDTLKETWTNITNGLETFWNNYIKPGWQSATDAFNKVTEWVSDNLSLDAITKKVDEMWDSVSKNITKSWESIKKRASNMLDKALDFWPFNRDKKEEKEKEEPKKPEPLKKVELKVKEVIGQVDELHIKDNILGTINNIIDRLKEFFSDKAGGFIDLSTRIIDEVDKNFKAITNHIEKINLSQTYNIDDRDTYKDSYDYSDRSQRTIENDNRITNNQDYSITYNIVDVPAVKRALDIIQNGQKEEILLLSSQNDYLDRMVSNMDGLGKKLSWLDPEKLTNQATNAIIPLMQKSLPPKGSYNASTMKSVQASLAEALV